MPTHVLSSWRTGTSATISPSRNARDARARQERRQEEMSHIMRQTMTHLLLLVVLPSPIRAATVVRAPTQWQCDGAQVELAAPPPARSGAGLYPAPDPARCTPSCVPRFTDSLAACCWSQSQPRAARLAQKARVSGCTSLIRLCVQNTPGCRLSSAAPGCSSGSSPAG